MTGVKRRSTTAVSRGWCHSHSATDAIPLTGAVSVLSVEVYIDRMSVLSDVAIRRARIAWLRHLR